MLAYYDLTDRAAGGGNAGTTGIFSTRPRSTTHGVFSKYVNDRKDKVTKFALPYWSNYPLRNSIVREMVGEADADEKRDFGNFLINGGTIEKQVHEDITYGDIHRSPG